MGVDAAALAALLWIFTQEFLLLAALCILVFAVDELFVDALYFAGLFKRWVRQPPWRAGPTARDLPAANSDRFAIFIPAWDEAGVIGRMLSHLTATLVQGRYDIFVGVYPNDPATRSAAAAVHDRRIRIVTGERSGPTMWCVINWVGRDMAGFGGTIRDEIEDLRGFAAVAACGAATLGVFVARRC